MQWVFFFWWWWGSWLVDNVCFCVTFFFWRNYIFKNSICYKVFSTWPTESCESELNYFWLAYENDERCRQCVRINVSMMINECVAICLEQHSSCSIKNDYLCLSGLICDVWCDKKPIERLLDIYMLRWLYSSSWHKKHSTYKLFGLATWSWSSHASVFPLFWSFLRHSWHAL